MIACLTDPPDSFPTNRRGTFFCGKWDEHGWFLTLKKGLHFTFNRFIFGIPYRCSQVYLKDSLFLYYSGRNGDCNCSTATYSFSYILLPKVAKSLLHFVWDLPAFFQEDLGFRRWAREIMRISSTVRWGLLLMKWRAPKADRIFPNHTESQFVSLVFIWWFADSPPIKRNNTDLLGGHSSAVVSTKGGGFGSIIPPWLVMTCVKKHAAFLTLGLLAFKPKDIQQFVCFGMITRSTWKRCKI